MRIYTYKQHCRKAGQVAKVITEQDSIELSDLKTCENPPDNLQDVDLYETFYNEYFWSPEECDFVEGTIEEIKARCHESIVIFSKKVVTSNNAYYTSVFDNVLAELEEYDA